MPTFRAPFEVLLVEDNPGDIRLVREALQECGIPLNLTVATDGEEALNVLHRTGDHHNASRPHLILLDLNLPKKSGHDVLRDVKQSVELHTIPVVVVSSTTARDEIIQAYQLSANCFVRKPMDLETTLQTIRDVCTFWFERVTLPV